MKRFIKLSAVILTLIARTAFFSQNETNKWYFGQNAGLDFMTNPPTILTNSSMFSLEGCASTADNGGYLLFYTNGVSVWNKQHVIMANGSGLAGNSSTSQSAVIVKKPGSTSVYYIFTLDAQLGANGLEYSVVDMSLAAGMGSVTTKNNLLYTPSTEKLTIVKHCNGQDTWLISHDWNSNNFRCYLITSAGVNTVAVVSSVGTVHGNGNTFIGYMKSSPNGRKIGLALTNGSNSVELYDFDNSTGMVSNPLILGTNLGVPYGCEFSPDATKFYCSDSGGSTLYQWNLCAGTASAIIASQFTLATTSASFAAMQMASNGKIYLARLGAQSLGVINNPNQSGLACNYVDNGQSIAPGISQQGLPNFILPAPKPVPPPFTYTTGNGPACQTATFDAANSVYNTTLTGCATPGYSVTNLVWDFGEAFSGPTNISTLFNPTHIYSSAGNYSVKLILYYSCSGGIDTLIQPVTVTNTIPSLFITGNTSICYGEKTTLTASGTNLYNWSTNVTGQTIAVSPLATTAYTVIGTNTTNGCSITKTVTVIVSDCTSLNEQSKSEDVFKLYPNPNYNDVFIETGIMTRLVIFNQSGEKVFEKILDSGKYNLDISHFSNGIYIVKSFTSYQVRTSKFIKTN